MKSITTNGGGDDSEDWVGGYKIITNKITMNLRQKSLKIII